MQRYKLNLQGGTYNEANAYQAVPIYRQQVVPGQTADIQAQVNIKTAAFTKNLTTPALASVWFFYVPHRLVWDNWPEFLSKPATLPSFPTTNVDAVQYFDSWAGTNSGSALYRRAVKLCYNEYFGTEQVGSANGAWFDDVTDDSVISLGRTRNPEQFASKIQLTGAVTDPEFSVVASTIPLNEFYRSMMNARSTQRSQMTGDKYVDTLARMGVDASWMISERPEFLGTKSQMVGPHLTSDTSATSTGNETARFQCNLECNIARKQFAEHGYIVGIASLRPIILWANRGPQDEFVTSTTGNSDEDWLNSFYSADNTDTKDVVWNLTNGMTAPPNVVVAYTDRFSYLKHGQWLAGDNETWAISSSAPANIEQIIYPSITMPVGSELTSGRELAITSAITMKGLTPVPQRVA